MIKHLQLEPRIVDGLNPIVETLNNGTKTLEEAALEPLRRRIEALEREVADLKNKGKNQHR